MAWVPQEGVLTHIPGRSKRTHILGRSRHTIQRTRFSIMVSYHRKVDVGIRMARYRSCSLSSNFIPLCMSPGTRPPCFLFPPPRLRAWRVRLFLCPWLFGFGFGFWLFSLILVFWGVQDSLHLRHPPNRARDPPPPRTLLKPSKFNIFGPQTNKNRYFLVSNL